MHLPPDPSWYLIDADGPAPVRLLTDGGHADPSLRGTPHCVLAELAEALHASAWLLSERELCHLRQFVALQRWRL